MHYSLHKENHWLTHLHNGPVILKKKWSLIGIVLSRLFTVFQWLDLNALLCAHTLGSPHCSCKELTALDHWLPRNNELKFAYKVNNSYVHSYSVALPGNFISVRASDLIRWKLRIIHDFSGFFYLGRNWSSCLKIFLLAVWTPVLMCLKGLVNWNNISWWKNCSKFGYLAAFHFGKTVTVGLQNVVKLTKNKLQNYKNRKNYYHFCLFQLISHWKYVSHWYICRILVFRYGISVVPVQWTRWWFLLWLKCFVTQCN